MKNFRKVSSGRRFIEQKAMKVMGSNSLGKLVYLGVVEVQIVRIIFSCILDKVFENLTKKNNFLKDLKDSGVSGFSV